MIIYETDYYPRLDFVANLLSEQLGCKFSIVDNKVIYLGTCAEEVAELGKAVLDNYRNVVSEIVPLHLTIIRNVKPRAIIQY